MSFNAVGEWSTPKRIVRMDKQERFLALTPQDVTMVKGAENYTDATNTNHKLATPFSYSKASNQAQTGIFQSLPGMSEKLTTIHWETDKVVHQMMHNSDYTTPYKAPNRLQWEAESKLSLNKKTVNRSTMPQLSDQRTPCSNSYTQKISPSQATQCQDLFTAKDEIIEQKDIIMRNQKTIITQLRQTNAELEELLLQKQQEIQTSKTEQQLSLHLREYQHQIALLKQQLLEAHSLKQAEIEKLQKKLGESEYEHGKLAITLKEMEISKAREAAKICKQFEMKVELLNSEKQKSEDILKELKLAKQENMKLQSYLEELPTTEEFKTVQVELKQLKRDTEDLNDRKEILQRRYKETKTECHAKDLEYKKLQKTNTELQDEVDSLTNTISKYRTHDKLGPISLEEHENLKKDYEYLKKENLDLRQSLDKRHKKMNRLHYDHLSKQKEFEQVKVQQEEAMSSIREELKTKSVTISKLNARNQELLSTSLEYQAELKKYKELYTEEYDNLIISLFREISQCTEDVKSFVNLCISRIKGKDPSLHALLGLQDSPDKRIAPFPTKENKETLDLEIVKSKLETITEIRTEVEDLRHLLSEQYAQEIGDKMCVTQ